MKKRIIVGISGASGVIYGVRTLIHLQKIPEIESHLVMSEGGRITIPIETDYKADDVADMADVVDHVQVGATVEIVEMLSPAAHDM